MSGQNGHGAAVLDELKDFEVKRILDGAEIALATTDRVERRVGKKRATIIGFAPSSFRLAPYAQNAIDQPDGYELWGINELYKVPGIDPEKFSCWFDIHDRRDGDISQRDPENIEWMRKQNFPVGLYMQDHYEDIPNSKKFPLEQAIRFYRTTYFTNSISYQLALAGMAGRDEGGKVIDENEAYGEVHVYGVDMAQADHNPGAQGEYGWQRPSCEYFLGFLRGMGIKVHLPDQTDLLFTPYLYGFQGDGQRFRKKLMQRHSDLAERENGYKNSQQAYLLNAAATEGASKAFANAAETLLRTGKIQQIDHDELQKHAAATLQEAHRLREKGQEALLNAAQINGAKDGLSYVERAWTGCIETYTPNARLYEPVDTEKLAESVTDEIVRHVKPQEVTP